MRPTIPRRRRLATKAEAYLRAGNWQEATVKARDAYFIKPNEPAAIRMVARVQGRTGHFTAAAGLWKQLVGHGQATPKDRQEYAENLLMSGASPEAGIEIEKLLRDRPEDAGLLLLATRWAIAEGDAPKARDFAAKALKVEPEKEEARLMLGTLQLVSGEAALRERGIKALLELGREPAKEGIESLRRLATQTDLPVEVVTKVIDLSAPLRISGKPVHLLRRWGRGKMRVAPMDFGRHLAAKFLR